LSNLLSQAFFLSNFLFAHQASGVFIESGAADGEYLSNTLWLERARNWTGLLVEPSPAGYSDLMQKRRKAWLAPVCLSPTASWSYVSNIIRKVNSVQATSTDYHILKGFSSVFDLGNKWPCEPLLF
jgi:hypothetical protein